MNSKFNQIKKLKNHIENKCSVCTKCSQKKIYKCMQSSCASSKLICPQCDVFSLEGNHFNHAFNYVLPLLMDSRPHLIYDMHQKGQSCITEVMNFLQKCIASMQKGLQQNQKALDNFMEFQRKNNLIQFIKAVENIGNVSSLDDLFDGVHFLTKNEGRVFLERAASFNEQKLKTCSRKPYRSNKDSIIRSIMEEIEKMTSPDFDQLVDPFFLLNKEIISIEKENSEFKNFKELYSDNWAYSSVQINLKNENNVYYKLLPFQQCRNLEIIQQDNSRLIYEKSIEEWIKFPNLRQITIRGDNQLINNIKRYCQDAKIINIHSYSLWDANILTYFSSMQEANFFFNLQKQSLFPKTLQHTNKDYYQHLEFLLNSGCLSISIIFQKKSQSYYWPKEILDKLNEKVKNKRQLIKLCLNSENWRDWPNIFKGVSAFPTLLQLSLPTRQNYYRENGNFQQIFNAEIKQLNKKGFEKQKAVTSLMKEYKLKKFIRKTKTKRLLEDIYQKFLIR